MLPVSLVLLGIISLVLYILRYYLIPNPPAMPPNTTGRYFWPIVAVIVIILVLLLWYVLPLHVGGA